MERRFSRIVSLGLGMLLLGGMMAGCAATQVRTYSPVSGVTRFDLGGVKVTAVNDGAAHRLLEAGFVRNASLEQVQAELRAMGLPADKIENPYTPLIVDVGAERVLLDAGNGEFGQAGTGRLLENMRKIGLDPKSVTAVVISHFHGDHINGLRNKAGEIVFPNAKIYVPSKEWDWWMDDARMAATPEKARGAYLNSRRVFAPIADKVVRFEPGREIVPGILPIPAYGHTPGHTVFIVSGEKGKLLYWADATNVSLFVRNPDWEVMFDMDPEAAKATRRGLADMAVRENLLVAGYHLPAVGTLSVLGRGYSFTPLP